MGCVVEQGACCVALAVADRTGHGLDGVLVAAGVCRKQHRGALAVTAAVTEDAFNFDAFLIARGAECQGKSVLGQDRL